MIYCQGTNTLTCSKLDGENKYVSLYNEPRIGGSGADSKITIKGTGTLNLGKTGYSTDNSAAGVYTAIEADDIVVEGDVTLNISQKIYGNSATDVMGINAVNGGVVFKGNTKVNINVECQTASVGHGAGMISEYKPKANVCAVKARDDVELCQSAGYLNCAVSSNSNTEGKVVTLNTNINVTKENQALYLKNDVNKSLFYNGCTITANGYSIKKYAADTDTLNYAAYMGTANNGALQDIYCSEVFGNVTYPKLGDKSTADDGYIDKGKFYLYRNSIKWVNDAGKGNDFTYVEGENTEYQFNFRIIPKPGYFYRVGYGEFTSQKVTNAQEYTPTYTSTQASDYLYVMYNYNMPKITTDNTKSAYYTCDTDALSIEANANGDDIHYKWVMDYSTDQFGNFGCDILWGDMDGFDGIDSDTLTVGAVDDNSYIDSNNTVGELEYIKLYCAVSTVAGTVYSAKTDWHPTAHNYAAKSNGSETHTFICSCGVQGATSDHIFTKETIEKAATCTQEGVKKSVCYCGYEKTEKINLAEHNPDKAVKENVKAATCTKKGSYDTVVYCKDCKAVLSKTTTVLPVTKHTQGKAAITAATASNNGKIVTKCTKCAKVLSESAISKIGKVALSKTSYTYTGKELKPTVTVKDAKGNAINKNYYTVVYKNNKSVGKATVTITFKGNYKGTKTLNFTINPKGTTISKAASTKKATATITVNKQATQTTGYEIQYSTSSKFTTKTTKTVKITSAKTLSKTISKLTSGKTYYFRVRTYKTVSKINYPSAWSKSVKARIK